MTPAPKSPSDPRTLLKQVLALPIIGLTVVWALFLWQLFQFIAVTRSVEHAVEVAAQAHELETSMMDATTALQGYLFEEKRPQLDKMHSGTRASQQSLDRLRVLLAGNPEQFALLDDIERYRKQWMDFSQTALNANAWADRSSATKLGTEIVSKLRAGTDALVVAQRYGADQRLKHQQTVMKTLLGVSAGVLLALTIFLVRFGAQKSAWIRELSKWQQTFENVDWGVAIASADSNTYISVNPAFARMHGYTVDEVVGRPVPDLFAPEVRHEIDRNLQLTNEQGHYVYESIHVRKDGSTFPVLLDVTAIKDEQGDVLFRAGHVRDISEMKRVESQLRAAEEKFRMLVESAPDTIITTDAQGHIVLANRRVTACFGYSPEELIGQPFDILLSRDSRARANDRRLSFLDIPHSRPSNATTEVVARRKDGTEFPVEISLSVIQGRAERTPMTMAIVRDVSDRKQVEEQQVFLARISEALAETLDYELALQQVAGLLVPTLGEFCTIEVITDNGARKRVAVVHADPAMQAKADELRSQFPAPVLRIHEFVDGLRAGKPHFVNEVKDEELRRFLSEAHIQLLRELGLGSYVVIPLYARGKTFGAITLMSKKRTYTEDEFKFFEEISRRAGVSVDNARLFGEAQKALKARDDTVAMVSHDLKNPLSSLKLSAQLIQRMSPSREIKQLAERIERSSSIATEFIDRLLDFARIEAGTLTLQLQPADAEEIVAEVCETLAPLAQAKSIGLEVNAVPAGLTITCDRTRVAQALANLVGNSIKFTAPGGRVAVDVQALGDEISFSVADTGEGIDPQIIPHIFDRYWQPSENQGEGMGLGLSIVKGIVEAHRGTIQVESRPKQGSRFRFGLPASGPLKIASSG